MWKRCLLTTSYTQKRQRCMSTFVREDLHRKGTDLCRSYIWRLHVGVSCWLDMCPYYVTAVVWHGDLVAQQCALCGMLYCSPLCLCFKPTAVVHFFPQAGFPTGFTWQGYKEASSCGQCGPIFALQFSLCRMILAFMAYLHFNCYIIFFQRKYIEKIELL